MTTLLHMSFAGGAFIALIALVRALLQHKLSRRLLPILWLLAVSYFITYYRDYHFDKEHGVVEWENIKRPDKNCVIRV